MTFKLKPGLGEKGFFDTKAFGEGGAPFKARFENGFVSFLSALPSIRSGSNDMLKNVFYDKTVEQYIHVKAKTGFNLTEAFA